MSQAREAGLAGRMVPGPPHPATIPATLAETIRTSLQELRDYQSTQDRPERP